MQKIERNLLAHAYVAGGTDKGGNSTATANSPIVIDASGMTVPSGASLTIKIDNSATANAGR
jgi:hypothetical protein